MRTTRSILLIFLVGIAASAALFLKSHVTVGQQQNFPPPNRKPACTCFCGDATFDSFNIFPKEAQLAGDCYGGPLPADVCGTVLADLPPAHVEDLCRRSKAAGKICPALKPFCKDGIPPTGKGCTDPATPWFGGSPNCKDVQAPVVAINNAAVTVSICGLPVFRGSPPPPPDSVLLEAYSFVVRDHVQSAVGSRVCCDSLREAARTGKPCYPGVDIDCDGKPNDADISGAPNVPVPEINLFTKQKGAAIDNFPVNLDPDDPNFMPESTARDAKGVGECPCKWQLTKGTLTCSPDGTKDHVYAATWTCPANGKEVFTTKYAKATAPCKEFKAMTIEQTLFQYMAARMSDSGMLPALQRRTVCGS